jgi:signal transduction histidine kinase
VVATEDLLGGRGRRLVLVALFGLASIVGGPVSTGLVLPERPAQLEELMRVVRTAPPRALGQNLPPQLVRMIRALAQQRGLRPRPEEVEAEVRRVMPLLMSLRGVPEGELPAAQATVLARLTGEGDLPGLFVPLAWSAPLDGALAVPLAGGLVGGMVVGAGAGALGAAFRFLAQGMPLGVAWLTLAAGILGGLVAALRGAPGDPPPARWGLALGAGAGAVQVVGALAQAPPGAMVPPVLVGGAVVAAGHALSLALFLLALRSVRLEQRRRAAEAAETSSRLALLSAQVRPHFLFNALNTLAAEIHDDPDRARHLVDCLARFLRRSLRAEAGDLTLAQELEDLEPYLELARARFEDRLHIEVDVPDSARSRQVPGLLLQPLVENSVHHGMREGGESLTVSIHAEEIDDGLVLEVRDDGRGADPGTRARLAGGGGEGDGVGLASVRAKLAARQPPGALSVRAGDPRGLVVRLELPGEGG